MNEEVIHECKLLQIVRQSPAKCDDIMFPWSLRVTYQRNLTNQSVFKPTVEQMIKMIILQ